ncbi:hypothetical protein EUX98_g1785 [Antrodiella citrinella]|uniref:Cytochrome P450 n=1 Tax=Antrodiella citrinella TaxID=2447956 RepID=A0A4S4N0N8_9APHY|nr:hypothetical protein EUX98_g1785 [Antrodiella citrinella]
MSHLRDALLLDVGLALLTHLVFNRIEPLAPKFVVPLLALPPLIPLILLLEHFSAPTAFCFASGVFHTVFISSVVFYRLSSIHPLARYPGPTLLKLSTFFVYKKNVTGRRHLYIQKLHEKYNSDIVRIGPNELSFRDVASIAPIMGTHGLAKGPSYDGLMARAVIRPVVAWRDKAVHAERRLPWNRALNTSAIKDYEGSLTGRVAQLVDYLLARSGVEVDATEAIKFFSYDFMGDMAFGGLSELMRDGDVHGQTKVVQATKDTNLMRETIPWSTLYFPDGGIALRKAAVTMATDRIKKGNSRRDLFHYLNNEDDAEPTSPPLHIVVAEATLAIVAGSDTTSGTLTNILYLLMQHPQVYKKLQEEVDKFYPQGENAMNCDFHPDMVFMEAVINEALRLYPVVPSGSQRATQRKGMTVLSDYIPPNTSVRIHTWSVHRDPRNFYPSPNDFWPERWIIAEKPSSFMSEEPFIHNANAFIAFSFGPANCVGKNLAMKGMKMVLCHLLQQVNLRFAEGFDPDTWDAHVKDYFMLEVGKLPVIVTPRVSQA